MKTRHFVLLTVLLAATAGCESPLPTEPDELKTLLQLDVSPTMLLADGLSQSEVTATIKTNNPVDPTRLEVQFETTGGTLLGGETLTNCETSGAVSCIKVPADRDDLKAVASLRSSTTEGPVTVRAILLLAAIQDSMVVNFGPAEAVLSFADTPVTGEADGATAVPIRIRADGRISAGTEIELKTSRGTFYPAGTGDTATAEVGADGLAVAELRSLDEPVSTLIAASVKGSALAPARHEIRFRLALPSRIVLTGGGTVAPEGTADLTAEFYREPGAGSVTAGITPSWSADEVDEAGGLVTLGVGRFADASPIGAPAGSPDSRSATVKFQAVGLEAGDRVRLTVIAEDQAIFGEHFLKVE